MNIQAHLITGMVGICRTKEDTNTTKDDKGRQKASKTKQAPAPGRKGLGRGGVPLGSEGPSDRRRGPELPAAQGEVACCVVRFIPPVAQWCPFFLLFWEGCPFRVNQPDKDALFLSFFAWPLSI